MSEPVVACCTCHYVHIDLQRKFGLRNCGKGACNMWKKKESEK